MPYFWDTTPGTLPRPELNPLANPALERNLTRWAQAYFSNPPGKREEAIRKLLQEIKNETSEILIAERARRDSSARSAEIRSAETRSAEIRSAETRSTENYSTQNHSTENQDLSCPNCQHRNPPEHQFCGQCGGGLNPAQSGSRGRSVFASTRPPGEEPSLQPDGEVQWLRDRALGHLYEVEAPAWRGWKYVMVGLAIALAGFAYVQWDLSRPTRVVSGVTTPAPRVSTPLSSIPPADKSSSAVVQRPPEAIAPVPNPSAAKISDAKLSEVRSVVATPQAQIVQDRETGRTGIQPAAQKSSLLAAPPIPMAVDSGGTGSADLRLAQRYLGGSMGARDSSEAAKLLWRAVGKQNTTAAILLSGLYARGDGVPKSCDQARLLLVAATRHGASQAAEQLRDLERRGCQ